MSDSKCESALTSGIQRTTGDKTMNQANVEALKAIFLKYISSGGSTNAKKVAEYLASEGVLVPSALTEAEVRKVIFAREGYAEDPGTELLATYERRTIVAELEQIAKGDVSVRLIHGEVSSYRAFAPPAWNEHWDSMPDATRALYATICRTLLPWLPKEIEIEAWGQLGHETAAAQATAWHMHNHGMRTGWRYLGWRAVMSDGTERRGKAPLDFSVENYGPKSKVVRAPGNWAN
jgi:hypothetical protein